MPEIEIGPDLIQIDADIVARALNIAPQDLRNRMRDGTVTSRFERGEGEDAGRVRLTFFSDTRRARITADAEGAVRSCSTLDYGRQSAPVSPVSKPAPNAPTPQRDVDRDRLDALLDTALDGTFPASDPIALGFDPELRG